MDVVSGFLMLCQKATVNESEGEVEAGDVNVL